jgi:hypothetical protein
MIFVSKLQTLFLAGALVSLPAMGQDEDQVPEEVEEVLEDAGIEPPVAPESDPDREAEVVDDYGESDRNEEPPIEPPPIDPPEQEDPPEREDPPEPMTSSSADEPNPTPDPEYGRNTQTQPDTEASPKTDVVTEEEKIVKRRKFSKKEINRYCRKYEGQLISYYDTVFKVENCKRREITQYKTVQKYQKQQVKINRVQGDVIAALAIGEPMDLAMSAKTARGCDVLEGRYVSYSNVDIYYVEKCTRRLFPDFATYEKHRGAKSMGEIVDLSWMEFSKLKQGEPIPTIMNDIFAELLSGDAGVDILPVDEACEGLEGKIASYYSKLYKIEKCRKREILSPGTYFKGHQEMRFVEMNAPQWLSLPDGEPFNNLPKKNVKQTAEH